MKSENFNQMMEFEKRGDETKGHTALYAYALAQKSCLDESFTELNIKRLNKKMLKILEQLKKSDEKKGRGTSPLKKKTSAANGKNGGAPKKIKVVETIKCGGNI